MIPAYTFAPWVGYNYRDQGFSERPLLILGESHYCANREDVQPSLTSDIITDLFNPNSPHEGYKNTYTKCANAVVGHSLNVSEKEKFWHSVAFYNYVQVPMSGPRVRPSKKIFRDSDSLFWQMLEDLRPKYVLVWGYRLYDALPRCGDIGSPVLCDGKEYETWVYTLGDETPVYLLRMLHPSGGFSVAKWHRVIKAFLN